MPLRYLAYIICFPQKKMLAKFPGGNSRLHISSHLFVYLRGKGLIFSAEILECIQKNKINIL